MGSMFYVWWGQGIGVNVKKIKKSSTNANLAQDFSP